MSEYNSENDIGIVCDNIDLIVYIYFMYWLDLKYYQSYLQSMNIELVSLQLMQTCNS